MAGSWLIGLLLKSTLSCNLITGEYVVCVGSDIWKQSRAAVKNAKVDIHTKLMKSYKQVPQWWFLVLLVGSIVLSLVMSFVWKEDVQLPWWGLLFAFGLAWIVTLPIGVIQATTNQVMCDQMLLFKL